MLARPQHLQGIILVREIGRRDIDGVDFWASGDLLQRGERVGCAPGLGIFLRAFGAAGMHGGQLEIRAGLGRLQDIVGDEIGADDGETNHNAPP